jgi:Aspartyl protease
MSTRQRALRNFGMSQTQPKSAGPVSHGLRVCLTRRAFLLLLGAVSAWGQDSSPDKIRFELFDGVPLVPAVVNGHKVKLLVDTGAGRSLLAAKLVKDSHGDSQSRIGTVGGDRLLKDGEASIAVGSFSVHFPHVLVDSASVLDGNADGLLGNDFWAAAGGIALDYKRRILTIGC